MKEADCVVRYLFDMRNKKLSKGDKATKDDRRFLEIIEYAYNRLTPEEKRIIQAEYININERNWWQDYYSRTTYYRLKKKTLKDFTEGLY